MILTEFDSWEAKEQYQKAKPFPFAVIDNFLDYKIANLVHKEFEYLLPNTKWYHYDNIFEKKFATDKWEIIPDISKCVLAFLNTSPVINVIEQITGIKGLIGDPMIRGGGIHYHIAGGKLDVHSDFWYHEKLRLKRRLNLLIYFNKDWKEEWNGHLELWDKDMTACQEKILPIFNRAVIFDTTDGANHGLPEEIKCPYGEARKSLAVYYYTALDAKDLEKEKHSTMFKKRPQDETSEEIEALRQKRNKGRLS